MKIILLEDVKNVGKAGQTLELKDGFVRNYLAPRGLVLPANKANYKKIEEFKKRNEKVSRKKKEDALAVKDTLEKMSLTITVEAKEDEEIYGSVTEVQIQKALKNEGIDLDKDQLHLEEPIKKIGAYSVNVTLHPDVQASLRVWVVKK